MKVKFVNFPLQYKNIKPEIDQAIQDCLGRGDLILRQDVEEFEKTIAEFVGTKYAIGVNSGTDALAMSLRMFIKQGDEVILPAHTFFATAEAVLQAGGRPTLSDIGPDLLMNMDDIERRITEKTKVIIPVHLAGAVCDMDKLLRIAETYNLTIIEDACQALGADYQGKMVGSFGATGCFSFYPAKILGCYGDAGMITTDDWRIAETLKLLRNHGGKPEPLFCGLNSRMDNLQAAVLNVKFTHIPEYISRRREIALKYDNGLSGVGDIALPISNTYQDYIIRTTARDYLYEVLKERGIETLKDIYPFPKNYDIPEYTKYARATGLRLPISPELTNKEIEYVIEIIKEFYK